MTSYPPVLYERTTLDLVLSGRSLARFGDGEFHLCDGQPAKLQKPDARLQRRLKEILTQPQDDLLVGIPNVLCCTTKIHFWMRMMPAIERHVLKSHTYASAFISRPDSAPWINTPDYWSALESLWIDQDVTIVRGGRHGLMKSDLIGARHVHEIIGPAANAWADHDELMDLIGTPKRVLLCLGPTATVLAADLCAKGVHAIDLGHAGLFLRKFRNGEPMERTEADKVA